MPMYEYRCRRCDINFSEIMAMKDHAERSPPCPSCQKADQVEPKVSTVHIKTSKKS